MLCCKNQSQNRNYKSQIRVFEKNEDHNAHCPGKPKQ